MTSQRAPSPRRERVKVANRKAILDAARVVFGQMGFDGATVRDIVRGTDLATGTFYNYFPDKDAVLLALLEETAVRARERVQEARAGVESFEDFVYAGFHAYLVFLIEDPVTFALLQRNLGAIQALYDDPSFVAGIDELIADLHLGISAGILPDHDVDLMASSMVGAGIQVGVRLLERGPEGAREGIDEAARFLATLFIAGMRAVARPPQPGDGARPAPPAGGASDSGAPGG